MYEWPMSFYKDISYNPDCLDGSDENLSFVRQREICDRYKEPSIECEDIINH